GAVLVEETGDAAEVVGRDPDRESLVDPEPEPCRLESEQRGVGGETGEKDDDRGLERGRLRAARAADQSGEGVDRCGPGVTLHRAREGHLSHHRDSTITRSAGGVPLRCRSVRRSGWRGLALDAAGASAYLVVAGVSLARSVRPGRTLVPADVLTQGPPFRALAGGFHAHNPVVSDASSQFFPWFRFLGNALRHGGIPQWNPLLLGGVRVTPNGDVSAYYPPTWLVRWLSPFDAYNAFVLFHLFLGALG